MTAVRTRKLVTALMVLVLAVGLVACDSTSMMQANGNGQSDGTRVAKDEGPDTRPMRQTDVEEISRHASNLPGHTRYTSFKDGEYGDPVEARDGPITKNVHFNIREVVAEVVPGTTRELWTFEGSVPGPMIRGRVGDTIQFHLHNPDDNSLPHNVDFHAVTGPGGGSVSLDAVPGESSQLNAKLIKPGIYVYHCAFPPIPNHIEHGMYGLVVVEPEGGLDPVDHEFYVMQHEYYTELGGDQTAGNLENMGHVRPSARYGMLEEPTFVMFNGRPGALAGERALGKHATSISTEDTVRMFVGNIGPNLVSSFHVIGEMFDTVYVEGSFDLQNNYVQSTAIPVGGAVGVEFKLEVPGDYTLVDHSIYRVNKGALGVLHSGGDTNPEVYEPVKQSDVRQESY